MKISVVICTHNRAELLKRALLSLSEAARPKASSLPHCGNSNVRTRSRNPAGGKTPGVPRECSQPRRTLDDVPLGRSAPWCRCQRTLARLGETSGRARSARLGHGDLTLRAWRSTMARSLVSREVVPFAALFGALIAASMTTRAKAESVTTTATTTDFVAPAARAASGATGPARTAAARVSAEREPRACEGLHALEQYAPIPNRQGPCPVAGSCGSLCAVPNR